MNGFQKSAVRSRISPPRQAVKQNFTACLLWENSKDSDTMKKRWKCFRSAPNAPQFIQTHIGTVGWYCPAMNNYHIKDNVAL